MASQVCEVVHWDGFNREFKQRVPASQAVAKAREWIKAGAVAAEVRAVGDDGSLILALRLERGGSGAAVQTYPETRSSNKKPHGDSARGSKTHS